MAFFLIVGALVLVYAFEKNVVVDFPIGLSLSLLGSCFWVCAE